MTEEVNPLDNFVATLRYTLKDINSIINILNQPFTTPVMAWANLIGDIQFQIEPQVEAFNKKGKDEPKTTPKKSGN